MTCVAIGDIGSCGRNYVLTLSNYGVCHVFSFEKDRPSEDASASNVKLTVCCGGMMMMMMACECLKVYSQGSCIDEMADDDDDVGDDA